VYNSRQVGGGGSWLSCSLLVFLGVWHLDRENSHALQKWPKQNHKHNPEARNDQHTVWTTDVVTTGTFLESSVRQSVVLANTHESQDWVGANVPSMKEEIGYSFGSCSSARLLAVAHEASFSPSGMLHCSPSWHVGSWNRQHTDW